MRISGTFLKYEYRIALALVEPPGLENIDHDIRSMDDDDDLSFNILRIILEVTWRDNCIH